MSFLDDELVKQKALYTIVCDKITSLVLSASEHSLNDGQIDLRVKNISLPELYEMKSTIANEISMAEGETVGAVHIWS